MEEAEPFMSPSPPPEPQTSTPPLSLFPVSDATSIVGAGGGASNWLRNSSFTVDLAVVDVANSSCHNLNTINEDDEDNEDRREEEERKKTSSSYELLESSGSDRDERGFSDRKKKKRKKKRKRERRDEDGDPSFHAFGSRKSGVRVWDNSQTKPSKDYYFDSRGDPDNLAFGSLYR